LLLLDFPSTKALSFLNRSLWNFDLGPKAAAAADAARCGLRRTPPGDQKRITAVSRSRQLRVAVLVKNYREMNSHHLRDFFFIQTKMK